MFLRTRAFSFSWMVISAALLAACTKGVPNVETLGSLGSFSVDQSQVSGKNFKLSGSCSDQYIQIQLSTDNGITWEDPSNLGSSNFILGCSSDGKFSGDFVFPSMFPSFLVRGIGSLGSSNAFVVAMQAAVPQRNQRVVAGAASQTGGAYKLSGAISYGDSGVVQTNGTYKLKGTVVGQ